MSDETVPRYSLEDDLEEAAERANRELPEQIRRVRARVAETGRKLNRALRGEDEGHSSGS